MIFWDENYEPIDEVIPVGTRVIFKENGYDLIAPKAEPKLFGTRGTVTKRTESGLVEIKADNRLVVLNFYRHEFFLLEQEA